MDLRPVGNLEKVSVALRASGFYYASIATCRYHLAEDMDDSTLRSAINAAVAGMIKHHAALSCTVSGERTMHAGFRRMDSVFLAQVIHYVTTSAEHDPAQNLAELHDQPWQQLDVKPAWKLVVFLEAHRATTRTISMSYVYNPALVDVVSAFVFHHSLLKTLKRAISSRNYINVEEVVTVPEDLRLTRPVEELIVYSGSLTKLSKELTKTLTPLSQHTSGETAWTGQGVQGPDKLQLKTRLKILSFPAAQASSLLRAAQDKHLSLKSLLEATVVLSLTQTLPEARRFVGISSKDLRRFTGPFVHDIMNQTTTIQTIYGGQQLDYLRGGKSSARLNKLWNLAEYTEAVKEADLAKGPRDPYLAALQHVPDYQKQFQSLIGKPRPCTFYFAYMSTPGSAETTKPRSASTFEAEVCTIDDMLLTYGASVSGAAFNVVGAYVRGGSLYLAFSWQEGVVQEYIMKDVMRRVQEILGRLVSET